MNAAVAPLSYNKLLLGLGLVASFGQLQIILLAHNSLLKAIHCYNNSGRFFFLELEIEKHLDY